jgi:hypothetical protein
MWGAQMWGVGLNCPRSKVYFKGVRFVSGNRRDKGENFFVFQKVAVDTVSKRIYCIENTVLIAYKGSRFFFFGEVFGNLDNVKTVSPHRTPCQWEDVSVYYLIAPTFHGLQSYRICSGFPSVVSGQILCKLSIAKKK